MNVPDNLDGTRLLMLLLALSFSASLTHSAPLPPPSTLPPPHSFFRRCRWRPLVVFFVLFLVCFFCLFVCFFLGGGCLVFVFGLGVLFFFLGGGGGLSISVTRFCPPAFSLISSIHSFILSFILTHRRRPSSLLFPPPPTPPTPSTPHALLPLPPCCSFHGRLSVLFLTCLWI